MRGHELRQVDEFVRLAAQFVGDHRRLRRDRRDDRDPHALALNRLDQRPEVAVAGEEHHEVEMVRHLHGVDRELDVHVAFDFPAPGRIDELLGRLRHDGIAVVIKPIDQRTDGRIFLIVDQGGIVEGSNQASFGLEFLEQALVVDIETKSLRACI